MVALESNRKLNSNWGIVEGRPQSRLSFWDVTSDTSVILAFLWCSFNQYWGSGGTRTGGITVKRKLQWNTSLHSARHCQCKVFYLFLQSWNTNNMWSGVYRPTGQLNNEQPIEDPSFWRLAAFGKLRDDTKTQEEKREVGWKDVGITVAYN